MDTTKPEKEHGYRGSDPKKASEYKKSGHEVEENFAKLINGEVIPGREKKDIEDIQQREKKLLQRQKENKDNDPYEQYTTMQVKRAQLTWTYIQTKKKLEEIKVIIKVTRESIEKSDKENPEYVKKYKEKYMQARKEAGIKEDDSNDNFIKYLGKDVKLDF